jgi:hypothetical protein
MLHAYKNSLHDPQYYTSRTKNRPKPPVGDLGGRRRKRAPSTFKDWRLPFAVLCHHSRGVPGLKRSPEVLMRRKKREVVIP